MQTSVKTQIRKIDNRTPARTLNILNGTSSTLLRVLDLIEKYEEGFDLHEVESGHEQHHVDQK